MQSALIPAVLTFPDGTPNTSVNLCAPLLPGYHVRVPAGIGYREYQVGDQLGNPVAPCIDTAVGVDFDGYVQTIVTIALDEI
jgi:hypothetical protein